MAEGDRERWNAIWRERAGRHGVAAMAEPERPDAGATPMPADYNDLAPPARVLLEHEALFPRAGRALDIAGGGGRHAIWLARRGLDVTVLDVSDLGLERAERRAADAHVELRLRRVDLEEDPLPPGPYAVVVCVDYLDRARRDAYADVLDDGGLLAVSQATVTNLERHARPGAKYLLEPGELHDWAHRLGLEVLISVEGWNDEGRHEAAVIARKRAR